VRRRLPNEVRPVTPADVRLTAQLVVDKRVFSITDASLEAMARRVLELEQHETALTQSLEQMTARVDQACRDVAAAIRARGAK